jgi:predicted DNA-binding transcriptional regulator YafY
VVLRFDREAGEHLWDTPLSVDQQIIGLPDGRMEVRATVTDSLQLRWWLLGFADGVEVVEPARLRDQLATKLRQAAARYD